MEFARAGVGTKRIDLNRAIWCQQQSAKQSSLPCPATMFATRKIWKNHSHPRITRLEAAPSQIVADHGVRYGRGELVKDLQKLCNLVTWHHMRRRLRLGRLRRSWCTISRRRGCRRFRGGLGGGSRGGERFRGALSRRGRGRCSGAGCCGRCRRGGRCAGSCCGLRCGCRCSWSQARGGGRNRPRICWRKLLGSGCRGRSRSRDGRRNRARGSLQCGFRCLVLALSLGRRLGHLD